MDQAVVANVQVCRPEPPRRFRQRLASRLFPVAIPKTDTVVVPSQPEIVACVFEHRAPLVLAVVVDQESGVIDLKLGAVRCELGDGIGVQIVDAVVLVERFAAVRRAFVIRGPERASMYAQVNASKVIVIPS